MISRLIGLVLAFGFLLTSCDDGALKIRGRKITLRNVSINPFNSFSDVFVDSSTLEQFIVSEDLDSTTADQFRSFYNSRNYQYAWFSKKGLNEPGLAFWNLLTGHIQHSRDSALFDRDLAHQLQFFIDGDEIRKKNKAALDQTELKLTKQFFIYASVAYEGTIDPEELEWFIPRKKIDALALLDSLVKTNGERVNEWEPVNEQYQALKTQLIRFNNIARSGGWPEIKLNKKSLKAGDSSETVLTLKRRLYVGGDLKEFDSSAKFNEPLVTAVKRAQKRFGFHEDGVVDKALATALNVPVKDRIEQILINMERMRWLPKEQPAHRIVANIPEFKVHIYENNQQALEMNIVVGKQGYNTVIFNDSLKYIVFSPYWNVPASIVQEEILPAMNRNPDYLNGQNMEQTGTRDGVPVIRQKPGGGNALGRVKFLFPNNHNIYFHDTPQKSLFNREKRAFSHGCMRLADAERFAQYLLKDDADWSPEKIRRAMFAGEEKWVSLDKKIPVYIFYFTAWVDQSGLLNFREDIYNHDKNMAEMLFFRQTPDSTVVMKR